MTQTIGAFSWCAVSLNLIMPCAKKNTVSAVATIGFVAGLLNGLIAIGGGVVIVPGLIRYRQVTPQVAVGTSLGAIIVLSSIAFVVHFSATENFVGGLSLVSAVLGGSAGTQVGARILAGLDTRGLLKLFAVFVFFLSLRLLSQGLGFSVDADTVGGMPPLWAYLTVGFASGVLSGVFGIGGGAMVLLGLAVFFNLPIQQGLALALAINVTNAVTGCIRHAWAGRVLWSDVLRLVPTALIGIAIGSALALNLPADSLRLIFGGFFLFMAVRIGRQAYSPQFSAGQGR